jgi:hypothetical protein
VTGVALLATPLVPASFFCFNRSYLSANDICADGNRDTVGSAAEVVVAAAFDFDFFEAPVPVPTFDLADDFDFVGVAVLDCGADRTSAPDDDGVAEDDEEDNVRLFTSVVLLVAIEGKGAAAAAAAVVGKGGVIDDVFLIVSFEPFATIAIAGA